MDTHRRGACRPDELGRDTCDPVDRQDWYTGNPARGQCGVTALVLNDLFGAHYWNRFAGLEVDLRRDQFRPDEQVVGGRALPRPDGPPKRCREEYGLLRERVRDRLDANR